MIAVLTTNAPFFLPGMCEKIPDITPTLALPHRGGGNFLPISIGLPSPLAGEGRVRGDISTFSQLPGE
jgi:hypothetical protein